MPQPETTPEPSAAPIPGILLRATAVLAWTLALGLVLYQVGQPLLDHHGFRQTFTALTAYWLIQNGAALAYETPLCGAPWTIPFEFPIYQGVVATVAEWLGTDLGATGRVVSFGFLTATLPPAWATIRRLDLPTEVFWVFASLLLTTPLYLYWGRSFLIETTALCFTVACAPPFLALLQQRGTFGAALLRGILGSLAMLQKVTTGLPFLALLGLVYLAHRWRSRALNGREFALMAIGFGVPVLLAICWTMFTDSLKASTPLGTELTSAELHEWHWGSLDQRLDPTIYREVFFERMAMRDLGGYLGLAILTLGVLVRGRLRRVLLLALLAGVLPPLAFLNLHFVHDYYQSSCLLFLVFALALAATMRRPWWTVCLTLALVACNLTAFFRGPYFVTYRAEITPQTHQELAIAATLKRELTPDQGFVAFGNNWTGSLAFYSERKCLMVPGWFKRLFDVGTRPDRFLGIECAALVVADPASAVLGKELIEYFRKLPTVRELDTGPVDARGFRAYHIFVRER